jgi:hypothetical protein
MSCNLEDKFREEGNTLFSFMKYIWYFYFLAISVVWNGTIVATDNEYHDPKFEK